MSHFSKLLLKFGVVILAINIVGMWVLFYLDHQALLKLQQLDNMSPKVLPEKTSAKNPLELSDQDIRLRDLERAQNAILERVDDLESSVSATQSNKSVVRTYSLSGPQLQKEYTIYLGEGSTHNLDWTTIQSTTISVDTNKYPGLTAVYFEAALSIIGGEAQAQLIDAESGALISSTALVNNTQSPTWKSVKVHLESGSHIYVVQLRSSSAETTTLSGARLRIIAN